VLICDVGPRDGLQNEKTVLDPRVRAELVDRLAAAGLRRIEAVSFVRPDLVPSMAGAEEVMEAAGARAGAVLMGLVLNERGYRRALEANVDLVNYTTAVTDGYATHNQNMTAAEGLALAGRVIELARADGLPIVVTLSCCFGCPYDGAVDASRVLGAVEELLRFGADEIVLADTAGAGVPRQVRELAAGARALGVRRLGGHFHNTRNSGLACAYAGLEAGLDVLDASVGGTGGSPFAPRATGNIATEDLVYLLGGEGIDTGVDLDALIEVSRWLGRQLGRELPGMVSRAGRFPPA
jgi:hydroxymethylglutaryl-CoA lyase/(R)-citramalyl-CoA lyase